MDAALHRLSSVYSWTILDVYIGTDDVVIEECYYCSNVNDGKLDVVPPAKDGEHSESPLQLTSILKNPKPCKYSVDRRSLRTNKKTTTRCGSQLGRNKLTPILTIDSCPTIVSSSPPNDVGRCCTLLGVKPGKSKTETHLMVKEQSSGLLKPKEKKNEKARVCAIRGGCGDEGSGANRITERETISNSLPALATSPISRRNSVSAVKGSPPLRRRSIMKKHCAPTPENFEENGDRKRMSVNWADSSNDNLEAVYLVDTMNPAPRRKLSILSLPILRKSPLTSSQGLFPFL